MSFERLGDVIDRVLSRHGIDVGNGAVAAAPNAGKGAPTEAGASFSGGKPLHASVSYAYREIAVATPAPRRASPTRAAAISLYVIDGMGGSRGREVTTPAAYRAAVRGGDARETVLKLVHASTPARRNLNQ